MYVFISITTQKWNRYYWVKGAEHLGHMLIPLSLIHCIPRGGARAVIVIVEENRVGESRSNSRWDWLRFTWERNESTNIISYNSFNLL